ncbi:hypothetical protein M426DRAFT_323946 [Hypoxylon sp. CI-4A]|nr:hypothetical protein M426DRAFT_323946 [Hypoxylon sp. CI-4A]
MSETAGKVWDWMKKNPRKAAIYSIGTVGGVAVVAPAAIAAPVLGVFGFGANGIVGGSFAAGIQGMIGNVAAGGIFATLQSAGMAGYGAAVVNGVVQAGGAFTAYKAFLKSHDDNHSPVDILTALLLVSVHEGYSDEEFPPDNGVQLEELSQVTEHSWGQLPVDAVRELSEVSPQWIKARSKESETKF